MSMSMSMSMSRADPRPVTVVATVVVGAIMVPIDATIVNVALTRLAAATGATLPVIQWVSTGYALALATALPLAAWLISRFGARTVFLTAIALFAGGSALVAASWNIESLIGFRVVQGLAGGVVMPATMTLVLGSAPPEQRGRMMALLGLPIMVGPILAPVLGGWLLDTLSWRSMFLINLPVGVLAVALGLRNLPQVAAAPAARLDRLGLALLPPAMALLVLATSRIGAGAPPAATLALYGAALVLVAAFSVHALRTGAPLLNMRLLGGRRTGGGTAVLFLFTGGYMAALILIPLYWQVARGESALWTGLLMAPAGIAAAATIRTSGRLIDAVPPLRVIGCGIAVSALAQTGLAVAVGRNAAAWVVVALWAGTAVGSAFTIMPATTTATRHLSPAQVPSGTTLLQVSAQIAAAACVAVVSVLLAARLAAHLPATEASIAALASAPRGDVDRTLPQVTAAFADAFWLPVALMAAAGLLAVGVFRGVPAPGADTMATDRGAAPMRPTGRAAQQTPRGA